MESRIKVQLVDKNGTTTDIEVEQAGRSVPIRTTVGPGRQRVYHHHGEERDGVLIYTYAGEDERIMPRIIPSE